jgi:hypothetical protein
MLNHYVQCRALRHFVRLKPVEYWRENLSHLRRGARKKSRGRGKVNRTRANPPYALLQWGRGPAGDYKYTADVGIRSASVHPAAASVAAHVSALCQ